MLHIHYEETFRGVKRKKMYFFTFRLFLSVFRCKNRAKRKLKKPDRYKSTSSEEQVKTKKPKHINEDKTKKKVATTLQDIRNTMNNENLPCNSNSKIKSKCTVTKAPIMYDQTYEETFTPYTQTEKIYNQENNNRLPYHTIPLTEKNVSNNIRQHMTDNFAQNVQRQTVDDLHSFTTTSMLSQQSSINENNFHRVLTHEPNMNVMDNHMKHKTAAENTIQTIIHPNDTLILEKDMQLLHNSQPRHQQPVSGTSGTVEFANVNPSLEQSNHIQKIGNTVAIVPLQITPPNEIYVENNTPLATAGNEMQQIIEVLHDLQRKMQYVIYFFII